MNPYLELGVEATAGDDEIRRAYLRSIQSHSPESDPEGFQVLHAAYELVKTEELRVEWRVFRNTAPGSSPLDVLERYTRLPGVARPMAPAHFRHFLRLCAK
ncbi:MAG TPA: J domain-containing protein [Verrucomicrobium sp.]|nr:J domain-containing protein [Verrucomicrobium sp.]